jgi:hypothetical protein
MSPVQSTRPQRHSTQPPPRGAAPPAPISSGSDFMGISLPDYPLRRSTAPVEPGQAFGGPEADDPTMITHEPPADCTQEPQQPQQQYRQSYTYPQQAQSQDQNSSSHPPIHPSAAEAFLAAPTPTFAGGGGAGYRHSARPPPRNPLRQSEEEYRRSSAM